MNVLTLIDPRRRDRLKQEGNFGVQRIRGLVPSKKHRNAGKSMGQEAFALVRATHFLYAGCKSLENYHIPCGGRKTKVALKHGRSRIG